MGVVLPLVLLLLVVVILSLCFIEFSNTLSIIKNFSGRNQIINPPPHAP